MEETPNLRELLEDSNESCRALGVNPPALHVIMEPTFVPCSPQAADACIMWQSWDNTIKPLRRRLLDFSNKDIMEALGVTDPDALIDKIAHALSDEVASVIEFCEHKKKDGVGCPIIAHAVWHIRPDAIFLTRDEALSLIFARRN